MADNRHVPLPTGAALLELVIVMDRLRAPGGCPWDAEQTHQSLVSYLTEEAYEAVEAIETADRSAMREELGDVLLQVMFHARIAQEHPTDPWSVDDVAAGIAAKLVARHPHVFGDEEVATSAHVESAWLARKTAEKQRESVLDGIPAALPALVLASKMQYRAGHGGLDLPVAEEGVRAAADAAASAVGPERIGDLLLALVAVCHERGIDAEACLRASVRDYASRVREVETQARAAGAPAPTSAPEPG